jgi:hypothetical protein
MYSFQIHPDKWVNTEDAELEQNKPYWFKRSDGLILMGAPFTNGYASGIADVYVSNEGLQIKTDTFHILLKNSQVQEVQEL